MVSYKKGWVGAEWIWHLGSFCAWWCSGDKGGGWGRRLGEGGSISWASRSAALGRRLCRGCSLRDLGPPEPMSVASGERAHRVPPHTPLASLAAQMQLATLCTPRPRRPGPRGGTPTAPSPQASSPDPHRLAQQLAQQRDAWEQDQDRMKGRNGPGPGARAAPPHPPGPGARPSLSLRAAPGPAARPYLSRAWVGARRKGRSRGCS